MTLAPEKAHILAAIQRGKEQAQRKDQPMKKQNDRCPLQQECERTCKVIGHERDCDYYVNNRYSTVGIPDQDEILDDEEATRLEEIEKGSPSDLSLAPSEPVIYQNDYGTLFAVREHNGAPALMCKPLASDAWTLSGVLAAVQGEAYTAEDLQEVLDEYARAHGWQKAKPESAVPPTPAAPASPADAGAAEQNLPAAGPVSLAAEDTDVPTFDYSGLDAQTVEDLHLAEREYMSGRKLAEVGLRRMADGVAMAHDALCCTDATNCRNGDGRFTPPEHSFGAWCDSVGLNRKAAERLLQVERLFDNSTPREEKVLEDLGPSLLYAAAKPSAPPELVQAVKNGDITSHKQYRELLVQYNAEKAAREQAEQDNDFLRADNAKARDAAHTYHRQYDEVAAQRNALIDQQGENIRLRIAAEKERDEALKQRDGARDALQAAKLRGDKLKAENDALKAQPVEAKIIDEEEVDRRAKARAAELTAPLREELEALRNRHPADPEAAEQAIRDAYDSTIYTGRVIENAWHTLRPLLPCMDAERRDLAIRQLSKTIATIKGEIAACL